MMEARFYEIDGTTALCRLCPHRCAIAQGHTGLCGVRRNSGGKLWAESYGRISGIALDPIEKKPLRRFYPGSFILSAGSYGCNLKCAFCQNSGISQEVPHTEYLPPGKLAALARAAAGSIGVAFTYNEPLVGIEYILDTAPLLREAGLKVVIVSNGTVEREPLAALLPFVDAMNIDVKGFTQECYRNFGGNLDAVKRTVELAASSCHVEVTSLIIPGENDEVGDMEAMSEWLASVSCHIPLHITRFFPRYKMSDRTPTPIETLEALSKIARRALKHVYIGNVR